MQSHLLNLVKHFTKQTDNNFYLNNFSSLNKNNMLELTIIGYLGKDAEIKTVNAKSVVNFSIAHTESYKDKNDVKKETTTWVECALWERENLAQYLRKGTQVMARGLPTVETYEKDKQTRVSIRLRVNNIQLLSKKSDELKSESKEIKYENPLNNEEREKLNANNFIDELTKETINPDLPF